MDSIDSTVIEDHELLLVNVTEKDLFKYIEKDGVYELMSNGTVTRMMVIRSHDGKMKFFLSMWIPTEPHDPMSPLH